MIPLNNNDNSLKLKFWFSVQYVLKQYSHNIQRKMSLIKSELIHISSLNIYIKLVRLLKYAVEHNDHISSNLLTFDRVGL